jgi:Flp pilus assembly protein TadB
MMGEMTMPNKSTKESENAKKLEAMQKEIALLREINELQLKNNLLKREITDLDRQLSVPKPEPGLSPLQPLFQLAVPVGILLFVIGVALDLLFHAFGTAMAFVALGAILVGVKLGLERRAKNLPNPIKT